MVRDAEAERVCLRAAALFGREPRVPFRPGMRLTAGRTLDRIQFHRRCCENVRVHREAGVNQLSGCRAGNENTMHCGLLFRFSQVGLMIYFLDDSIQESELLIGVESDTRKTHLGVTPERGKVDDATCR